jgi:small subunit ribosomal protein S6
MKDRKEDKMAKKTADLQAYEGVIIVKADASEEKQKALFQKNKQIIEALKGSVNHVDTWGRRKLANPIKKERSGVFFHTTFSADPQTIAELERTMRINEDVLRFMHTKLKKGTDFSKFMQDFRDNIIANQKREKDFQEKIQARKKEMKPSV